MTVLKMRVSTSGFTLLEVMIAMAIFSIGILAIVGIQGLIVRGNTSGNIVTEEMLLAQRQMEILKNNPTPSSLASSNQVGVDREGNPGGPYNIVTSVINPVGGNTSRFITVVVTKTGPGGHPVTIRSMTHGNGI